MRPISVRIDTNRLRERLSSERAAPQNDYDVHQWLHRMGFTLEGAWSCGSDEPLKSLRPDEVLEVMCDVEVKKVHFVYRHGAKPGPPQGTPT
jgi:hypothetical protein